MARPSRRFCSPFGEDGVFGTVRVLSLHTGASNHRFYKRTENAQLLRLLPHMPLMWRLAAAENIIFSGFQLELYAPHERTFAYWYLTQVIETHLGCIEDVLVALQPGIPLINWRFRQTDRHLRNDRISRNEVPSHFAHCVASVGYRNDRGRQ